VEVMMCGRYTLSIEVSDIMDEFDLQNVPVEWRPRYNVAPSQPVAVITSKNPRSLEWMRWGLVPSWAKDIAIGNRLINARSETILEKPSFRSAFNRRRCLILANGFFEWQKQTKGGGIPYYFFQKDKKPFAMAGIWELWQNSQGDELLSCAIITCAANSLLEPIHERMPVILDRTERSAWLSDLPSAQIMALLAPYPAEKMDTYPISRLVNDPKIDVPEIVDKI